MEEANALIPLAEETFSNLAQVRARLKKIKGKIEVLEMLWGEEIASASNPDHKEYRHYLDEVSQAKSDYEAACKRLADQEIVLKSVEAGLVDFYGVIDRRLVFLCWKRGEEAVEHYHHLEDGFQGRKPIPKEMAR
ncbi:MAG: DUF2203 domain-containing protein [Planctomycetes bacterium]|nr:DUF2203 domain-containing protein [Planctomycetota bacterium]